MADTIEGTIEKVLFHKVSAWSDAGIPYLIAILDTGDTVKGEMLAPANGSLRGERCRFYGEFRPDKRGIAFNFDHHEPLIDATARGVVDYLSRHVEGVGHSRARLIFDTFGPDTIRVLRSEPERLKEVSDLSPSLIEKIVDHFSGPMAIDPGAYAALVDLLAPFKVHRKLIISVLKDFGSDAPAMIRRDPYLLLDYPRIGWDTVDAAAIAMGYPRDGDARHSAAIRESLTRIIGQGHTVALRSTVQVGAGRLLSMVPNPTSWVASEESGKIFPIPDSDYVTTPRLAHAEKYIAERIALIRKHAPKITISPDLPRLTDSQRAAVATFFDAGFMILSGAPGTGKTFTVAEIIDALLSAGYAPIRFMAPTGKAAKRGEELIRKAIGSRARLVPCTTIHRALGIGISDEEEGVPAASARPGRGRKLFGFHHDEVNPMDGRVFVVDESSMVDVSLMASLLAAIPLGAMVLIVGDPNQLPSIGSGSALRDLIDAGIPSVTLNQILRSDGGGRVVRACHAIKDGLRPDPAQTLLLPSENWIHIECEESQIAPTIVNRIAKIKAGNKMGFHPVRDVQVISPQKTRHEFGCQNLNLILSDLLNPDPSPRISEKIQFRTGDKVIRRKNQAVDEMVPREPEDRSSFAWSPPGSTEVQDWKFQETAVVNGDMGTVLDIIVSERGSHVIVQFENPDRLCRLPLSSCHLEPAYAITVHSAQGSGFPVTIVPVSSHFYFDESNNTGLWCRELLYTAISRAEQLLITVGPFASIGAAIRRRTVDNRKTWLPRRIAEVAARPVVPVPPEFDCDEDSEIFAEELDLSDI